MTQTAATINDVNDQRRSTMKSPAPFVLSLLLHIAALTNVSSMAQVSPALVARVRIAMSTTTQSQSTANVTQTYDARDQWDDIMTNADQLPEKIRGICYALYASCQARVGQDTLALQSYQHCLNLKVAQDTRHDATMGKAFCLQRLMKYSDAMLAFLECDTERACLGAATCCLRLRHMQRAMQVLGEYSARHPGEAKQCRGMLATLMYLQATTEKDFKEIIPMLEITRNESPLTEWVYQLSLRQQNKAAPWTWNDGFDFLHLAAVNQSPFDDPFLIHLDDKVLLHELLTSKTDSADVHAFWPRGYILPRDESIFKHDMSNDKKEWILKEPAGYGSHGNQLVGERQAVELWKNRESDMYLCQQFVSPPLLLEGYKFSMRLYVVYFPKDNAQTNSANVYLCDQGLVKLAALLYQQGSTDDRIHMTNSGRENQMGQCDLTVLREAAAKAGWSYNALWNDIREAVRAVVQTYLNFREEDQALPIGALGIPKILGFDFIVDSNCKPFLLEVNRFPGLEPRDASDSSAKRAVVYGSWMLAADRLGMDSKRLLKNVVVAPCFFERIL
jgi:hypothetical protein